MLRTFTSLKGGLAFYLVTISAIMVFTWMVMPPKVTGEGLALLAGFLMLFLKMTADAVGYQFNSSSGSERKDEIIQNAVGTGNGTPTPDQLARGMLANGEKIYFDKIASEDEKKAFLAMSAAERAAVVAKAGT